MKILLVGEGACELGGALEALVRQLGLADAEFECDHVSRNTIHVHRGKGPGGYFKRAVRWMLEAQKGGYDAIVLVIDQDDCPERLKELGEAQQYGDAPIRRAFGVAIRTFDAWFLADEAALTKVLGYNVSRQPDPEYIGDPKRACRELIENAKQSMNLPEMYAQIAKILDVEILQTRCQKGFAPFAKRVQDL